MALGYVTVYFEFIVRLFVYLFYVLILTKEVCKRKSAINVLASSKVLVDKGEVGD